MKKAATKGLSRNVTRMLGISLVDAFDKLSDNDKAVLINNKFLHNNTDSPLISKVLHETTKAIIDKNNKKEILKKAVVAGISQETTNLFYNFSESYTLGIIESYPILKELDKRNISLKRIELTLIYEIIKELLNGKSVQKAIKKATNAGLSDSIIQIIKPFLVKLSQR